jgi:lysozyme family protein
MANFEKLIPFILRHEGGYAEVPGDLGGATNSGITIGTFRQFFGADKTKEDLKKMTDAQWKYIFEKGFLNKCKADQIKNESVAFMLVDFAFNSGVKTAVKVLQRVVGTEADGVMGPKTLAAVNAMNGEKLFYRYFNARHNYLYQIISHRPTNGKFEIGWLRRIYALYRLCY